MSIRAIASATRSTGVPPLSRGAGPQRYGGLAVAVVALGLATAFPFVFTNPAFTTIGVFTLIYVASASAWNLFAGFSGYIALGNAVFFGSGAYALANVANHTGMSAGSLIFLLVPVAGVAGGLVAIPVGWLALRTRRHTFVVVTIAIFFIFQLLGYNLKFITNGSSGMSLPIPTTWGPVGYNTHFYVAALVVAVVAVIVPWLVRRSRFGLDLFAIRDDEDRSRGLGVSTERVKLTAFTITGALTGMAGGVYAYFVGSIYPQFVFDPLFDISIALMSFFGGLGTVSGPVLGAVILEALQQYFTLRFSGSGLYLIAYGVLFLVVIRFLPQGVVPSVSGLVRRWQRLRAERGTPPTTPEPTSSIAGSSAGEENPL